MGGPDRKRTRGERAGLTRDRVLDAALALADREGRKALTMRRLGAELGVEAMTLYHHVPNKDALLDGLVERVVTEALPEGAQDTDWRTLLRTYAEALREGLLRHPGVLPLVAERPAVTPATLDVAERGLTVLTAAGFGLGAALDALNALTLFVVAHATAEAASRSAAEDGPGSTPWVAELDGERYPLLVRAARTGAGTDDVRRFRFAVEVLIAGLGEEAGAGA
ncbi:TetR/AcrR family transcriptional regulator C-terminal domain-containing protein [Streptomyces sp. NPDC001262]|uniref:TetR/AcrR family transcriptional regulator C-terminal domain-containing protein n=1 Tax=unclassified Streptomyces TaxID=2593676 RepID=UPI00368788B6